MDPGFEVFGMYVVYKYVCFVLLVIQTTSTVLVIRYSRITHREEPYLATTVVCMTEVFKMVASFGLLVIQSRYSPVLALESTVRSITTNIRDFIKLGVPAVLYTLQTNLLLVALGNLDAATFQITYQLKILTTALFSVLMLRRSLAGSQWLALILLTIGVILIQIPSGDGGFGGDGNRMLGLSAVLTATCSSAFAGVYFEIIIKSSPFAKLKFLLPRIHVLRSDSVWLRNIQLALFSFVIALIGVGLKDFSQVREAGFFQGYDFLTWTIIVLQGLGGLLVAALIKLVDTYLEFSLYSSRRRYADNIMKGFAASLSIVLSAVVSGLVFDDFRPTLFFLVGGVMSVVATVLYAMPISNRKGFW